MNVRFAVILIITGFVSSVVSAQDEITVAEEVLRYFPAGIYDGISHQDEAVYATTLYQNYPDYIKSRIDNGDHVIRPLRMSLIGKNISYTRATLTSLHSFKRKFEIGGDHKKIETVQRSLRKEMSEKGYRIRSYWFDEEEFKAGGKVTFVFKAQDFRTLHVFRYEKLDDYLAELTKYNHFAPTEHQIDSKPVYRVPSYDMTDSVPDCYIYATSTNELLVAASLDDLRTMVAAGNGTVDTLLNDTRYPGLVSTINDLPNYYWRIGLEIIDRGVYPYANIKIAEQIPLWVISYLDFSDVIRDVHLYIHPDEKRAAGSAKSRYWDADLQWFKWSKWEEDKEFQHLTTDNYTVKQLENRVIRTFIHTKRFIEHYIKRDEELNRKARSEWRKKQEEKALKK